MELPEIRLLSANLTDVYKIRQVLLAWVLSNEFFNSDKCYKADNASGVVYIPGNCSANVQQLCGPTEI